jgi:hypothetical protein
MNGVMERLALGAIAALGVAAAVATAGGSGAGGESAGRLTTAPKTTVRPCSSRAEPGWQPRRSDLVWGYPPRGGGPVRSGLGSYAAASPSLFASRADSSGFRRYIHGPRGRRLPTSKRERLLRLARHHYGRLKTPFAVRAGHRVTLEIAEADRPHASFISDFRRHGRQIGPYWSYRVADGTPRARLIACPVDEPMFSGPGTVGPWTAFPGAMVVAGARCLTIEVREPGHPTFRYYLGFGRNDCRGPAP